MSTTLINRGGRNAKVRRAPRVLQAYIAGVGLFALAMGTLAVVGSRGPNVDNHLAWPLIVVAMLAALSLPVRFYTGGESLQMDLMAIPVVVGAVFVTPVELLGSVAASMFLRGLITREVPEKIAFNVLNALLGAAVTRLTVASVLGTARPEHLIGLGAVTAGVLVFELAGYLGVFGAVALSSGRPTVSYLKTVALQLALVVPLNAVMATITVAVAIQETWGVLLVAVPGFVLGVVYRSAKANRARFANLETLYDFTVKLAGLSGTEEIIEVALREAVRLLRCDRSELVIPIGASGVRCRLAGDDPVRTDFVDLTDFEREIVSAGESVMVPTAGRQLPEGSHYRDLMAVPLQLGDVGVGVFTVGNHTAETESFERDDLKLFEALTANLGTALTSSHRLDRLRREVADREHDALHDSLTGLGNRTLFAQWVARALDERKPGQLVAVMLMDLDGFKDINDTLGHQTGDAILKEVAGRVLMAIGPDRLAARLGGDEFAFVLPEVSGAEEVIDAAETLLRSVSRAIAVDGLLLEVRASLGIAVAPQHGTHASTLLQRADVAMYSAKSTKRGVVAYDREIDQHNKRRLILATELRRALDSRELELWYQPVASMETGEIAGLEGLLRWRHREYGSISPNEFIPVAEQTGLIDPLTWWVLESAIRELHRWRLDGYDITMAVNVSARSLLGSEIVERLRRLLNATPIPPARLTLELTESLMMVDPEWSERILAELTRLGVRIAIDDFGTGYSSLSRLKRLPVHMVKIDRSFVTSMNTDEGDEAIVRATIDLAKTMGHVVVAEGVENQETWDRLREFGCNLVQGYLLAAAMPSSECRQWVRARQSPQMASVRMFPRIARGA